MTNYLPLLAAAVGGYLLGSIPFGVIATRLGGAGDITKLGSGNIGATNVLRTGRKDLAALTLIGDVGKGIVAVVLAWFLTHDPAVVAVAGGAAFLGHLFPVWLRFKGGKGVATFFGVLLFSAPPVGLAAAATWIAMAFLFRISSLAALTAAALAPVYALLFDQPYAYVWLALFMGVLIFVRHRANIQRLLNGQEPKIGAGKKKD
ncbi:glycerol-3-phosphate 1-O-acyltransferase PlsY [Caulobacter sp. 17J65-9]|uniref:glycerol-3-phosphate 1-O-acyltransferase PlsY n=1 Tax=Caulobacter sp. 17J65-9 TaxID=2709382 RepID=UPI0032049D8F